MYIVADSYRINWSGFRDRKLKNNRRRDIYKIDKESYWIYGCIERKIYEEP